MDTDKKVVDFVTSVFKAISETPEEVTVELIEKEEEKILNVRANASDYSRFIGKDGVIINSVRKLIFSISADNKCRWIIDIPQNK